MTFFADDRNRSPKVELPPGTLNDDLYMLVLERLEEAADNIVSEAGGNITDFVNLLREIADCNVDMFEDEDQETRDRLAKGGMRG